MMLVLQKLKGRIFSLIKGPVCFSTNPALLHIIIKQSSSFFDSCCFNCESMYLKRLMTKVYIFMEVFDLDYYYSI